MLNLMSSICKFVHYRNVDIKCLISTGTVGVAEIRKDVKPVWNLSHQQPGKLIVLLSRNPI